jgi:plasmid stability protein
MATKQTNPKGVLVKVYLSEGVHRRLKTQAASTGRVIGEEAASILDQALPRTVTVQVVPEVETAPNARKQGRKS